MARTTGAKCKLCRREGVKLFLKGSRCVSTKCPFSSTESRRLPSKPGAAFRQRRKRMTEYGRRLREKQKLKRFYGVLERQFRRYFKEATRLKGNAGENLLLFFERRLDNVICLSGIAASRSQARQLIRHGFIFKNDKRLDIPSYLVKQGEEFELRLKDKGFEELMKENLLLAKQQESPNWIDLSGSGKGRKVKILSLPTREYVSAQVNEQLIIEISSR